MTFQQDLWHVLRWRPREALRALYWRCLGKRLRSRNILRRALGAMPWTYDCWSRVTERNLDQSGWEARQLATLCRQPKISILIIPLSKSGRALEDTIASVLAQGYSNFEVLLPTVGWSHQASHLWKDPRIACIKVNEGVSLVEAAIGAASGEYLLALQAGDHLPPHSLLRYLSLLQDELNPQIVYGDQDLLDADGRRHTPWWKPEWDLLMLLSQDFITRSCIVRIPEARAQLPLSAAERAAPLFALVLRIGSGDDAKIRRLPQIQSRLASFSLDEDAEARMAIVGAYLGPEGGSVARGPFGSLRIDWPLPEPLPHVTIVVPTRDKSEVLRSCLESVLAMTDYSAFDILIVDNGSSEEAAKKFLKEIARDSRVTVMRDERSFNYSGLNNAAVAVARGDYICLLNNDTEVISADWLTAMIRYAVRSDVGAVGAKLLYPTGQIQHAGVVVGMGEAAGHAHRFQPDSDCGYYAQAHIARGATAVTAACLVLSKAKFLAVSGLDEQSLAIAFNDVDLCLKLREAGYSNVYQPAAVLYHHESISRGDDLAKSQRDRYFTELAVLQSRWGTKTFTDPYHHPMLERSIEQYVTNLRMEVE